MQNLSTKLFLVGLLVSLSGLSFLAPLTMDGNSEYGRCLAEAVTGGICPDARQSPLAAVDFHVKAWQQIFGLTTPSTVFDLIGFFFLVFLAVAWLKGAVLSTLPSTSLPFRILAFQAASGFTLPKSRWQSWWSLHEHSPSF